MRTGRADLARQALGRLSAMIIEGSDWAKGLEARSRALVSEGREAEQYYGEAVERLGRTQLRPDLARAHLLYGEWLRRENRRLDARHQLHAAYQLLDAIGAEAFAERARRELLATGEKVRKREVDTHSQLTPQEEHIIRLARGGRTNPEIAAGTIHQYPHRRMAPAQGVRQAGHRLSPGSPQHCVPARSARAVRLDHWFPTGAARPWSSGGNKTATSAPNSPSPTTTTCPAWTASSACPTPRTGSTTTRPNASPSCSPTSSPPPCPPSYDSGVLRPLDPSRHRVRWSDDGAECGAAAECPKRGEP